MRTNIKKVKASGGMYCLTAWEKGKQGVKQTQSWHETLEAAKIAETKMLIETEV